MTHASYCSTSSNYAERVITALAKTLPINHCKEKYLVQAAVSIIAHSEISMKRKLTQGSCQSTGVAWMLAKKGSMLARKPVIMCSITQSRNSHCSTQELRHLMKERQNFFYQVNTRLHGWNHDD